jgi:molybdenum cofactor biosynthesis protein B
MSKVVDLHKAGTPKQLGVYIITCSTSKYAEHENHKETNDTSGDIIEQMISRAGHRVEGRKLLPDSKSKIQSATRSALASQKVDALIITGGTGVSPHDITIESIRPFYEKEMPGFGELFRRISFDTIGSPAMLSRASAGVAKGKAIFCLPGSPDAVQTAVERLIIPELPHLIKIGRQR